MKNLYTKILLMLTIWGNVIAQPVQQMGTQQFVHPTGTACTPPATVFAASRLSATNAATTPPRLRVAYIIPSNRTAQANAVADMQYVVMLAQAWYREQMKLNGFGEKTFVYESEPNSNRPKINFVNSSFTDDYIRADPWGRSITAATNGGLSIWAPNEVWFLIAETHQMNANSTVVGGIALGAGGGGSSGGVALVGSDWLAFFNKLTDNTPYNGQTLPALGPYQMIQDVTYSWADGSTFSSAASSFIGGALHEIGHAFGLPHDQRNDANRFGNVMHNGFRGSRGSIYPALYPTEHMRLEYAAALYLNTSHKFNRNQRTTDAPNVNINTPSPTTLSNGQLAISFTASDADTLTSAFLMYNGDRVAELSLLSTSITTQFITPYYDLDQSREYKVLVVDKQGNVNEATTMLTVQSGGNQAPRPFISVEEPSPRVGQSVALKASSSSDGNEPLSNLSVQWDINNDGTYDTGWLSASSPLNFTYQAAGNYLIKAKVKDQNGAESIGTPITTRVSNTSGSCRYLIPPLISGNTLICSGTSTTLTARGCPGTVVWSGGSTGNQLVVSPTVSTTYSAYCQLPDGCQSLPAQHQVGLLTAPTNLTTIKVYGSQVLLGWNHTDVTGPFTVEYKPSTSSSWIAITGLTVPSTYINSLTNNTVYDWRVTIGCVTSAVANFTTNAQPTPQYCSISFSNPCQFGIAIKDVVIGGTYFSQNSACKPNGYDFSLYPINNLVRNQTYSFSLALDGYYNGSQAAIWLDFNGDGQFQSIERIFTTTQEFTAPITGSFQIPANSPLQTATRLRIVLNFNSAPTSACGNYGYGEAEDYLVNIVSPCVNMVTTKEGLWNDPTVWTCGRVPTNIDAVTLGHLVTMPSNYTGQALTVQYTNSGRLVLNDGGKLKLVN
ncbi:PKD domain-containing protein [Spirosoma sp. BT702]|uniref:PKD domain-containing protein n=1 Tax=Spirosoma profusum TaxID=2771354 RepID=A0A927AUZ2_9BACT|nr:GEVED domain-containing protein [Spirosoma profusum]MBD2704895.1 PKD domain-containing protein [Spirosoma profusum]